MHQLRDPSPRVGTISINRLQESATFQPARLLVHLLLEDRGPEEIPPAIRVRTLPWNTKNHNARTRVDPRTHDPPDGSSRRFPSGSR